MGPDGVVPRVVFGAPTRQRLAAIQRIMNELPTPADYMFHVSELNAMVALMEYKLMDY